ncbi:MAG: Uncharacterized protein CEO19_270 [Parcubacteria group bacterium Gr01-1014_73]|nr:MAG: Uncharacterized protein CEO19_270 [Parcubacteria group bacterium Gr01-1014_73]
MTIESASIQAIRLTRAVFESVYGNIGLLKFAIEELVPTNGNNGQESKRWDIICSFYETLGSTSPSRYKASVNLNDNTVTLKKLGGEAKVPEGKFKVTSANNKK